MVRRAQLRLEVLENRDLPSATMPYMVPPTSPDSTALGPQPTPPAPTAPAPTAPPAAGPVLPPSGPYTPQ